MIDVVTGGKGFIGRNLIEELKKRGHAVVSLDIKSSTLNYIYNWLLSNSEYIECIYHLGAITDTTLLRKKKFDKYNVEASIFIWNFCCDNEIPLIYASSAATYGNGENGFDDQQPILNLKPLNPYGISKQEFDMWILEQEKTPPFWIGLKFFNVYGYGEQDKGKMSSVAFQLFNQLSSTGHIKLFKSHHLDYKDGEQLRDFIYVNDVINVCIWMYDHNPPSGIYNVGTGKSRTFYDLAKAVYSNYYNSDMNFYDKLSYFDIPEKIREKYQYFTEAKMDKLRKVGYSEKFYELEDGIKEYVNKLQLKNFKK